MLANFLNSSIAALEQLQKEARYLSQITDESTPMFPQAEKRRKYWRKIHSVTADKEVVKNTGVAGNFTYYLAFD